MTEIRGYYLFGKRHTPSRNQDSGKVFYLEKQGYVDSCEHTIFILLLTILANLSVPQNQGHRHRIRSYWTANDRSPKVKDII